MNKIKKFVRTEAEFAMRHKAAIACLGVIALHVFVVSKHNEFLQEHDLFDEYYKIVR